MSTGSVIVVIVDGLKSGPSTPYAGGWVRGGNENTAGPAAQSWNRRTQNDVMRISHTDLDGTRREVSARGFEARVILHEMDHLDGVLILDRVSSLLLDVFPRKRR